MLKRLAVAAASTAAFMSAASALADPGHEPQPQPLLKSVEILQDHGARVDVAVTFELTNPETYPYKLLSASALGGATVRVEDGAGGALTPEAPAGGSILVAPPVGRMVIEGGHRGAMAGVGLLVTLVTDDVGELQMLVKLP